VRDQTDDPVVFIDKNDIDRELHKKHVNGLTPGEDKRFAGFQVLSAQKAGHSGEK
jgi:hypothetical protein